MCTSHCVIRRHYEQGKWEKRLSSSKMSTITANITWHININLSLNVHNNKHYLSNICSPSILSTTVKRRILKWLLASNDALVILGINAYKHQANIKIHMRAHVFQKSDAAIWAELYHMVASSWQWHRHKTVLSKTNRIIVIKRYFFNMQSAKQRFSLPLMLWPLVCLGITLNRLVKWCVITAMILSFQA